MLQLSNRREWRAYAALGCLLALLSSCAPGPGAQTAPTPTPRPAQPALEKPTYTVQSGVVVDEPCGRQAEVHDEWMLCAERPAHRRCDEQAAKKRSCAEAHARSCALTHARVAALPKAVWPWGR